jgi:TonB-linked SusC/RagA family outer membrane protein
MKKKLVSLIPEVFVNFRKLKLIAMALAIVLPAIAQNEVKVKGTVVSNVDGYPLIGVNVLQKGTMNGVITDLYGNFELTVPVGSLLEFSYIGCITQTVTVVAGKTTYDVTLVEDSQSLDEVVVVGYGVQKKKLVTGATVQVSGDKLQKLSTTNAFTAMQSQTPGVKISQNSGQPGEGFKVSLRGIGTVGDYAPLYVIDGVAGGSIENLNPSDIESIDVLKDAASAAIYGARAANGVILVTTKQGKSGKIQVTYDGYYGVQNVYKMPTMLNAKEYMAVMDEMRVNDDKLLTEKKGTHNWQNALGQYYNAVMNGTWEGTNWLEAIRNENAPIQNHAVNLAGGTDASKFSMGVSYTGQEGIFGKPVQSEYERTTVRLNSDHVIWKSGKLDIIKFGENLNYSYSLTSGIGVGNQYGNDISNMLRAAPIMPIFNDNGEYFNRLDNTAMGLTNYDPLLTNPIALMVYERGSNRDKSHALNMSANIQIQPIKDLVFKSQFGYKMTADSYRSMTHTYDLSSNSSRQVATVEQNGGLGWSLMWDNTLNYRFNVDQHHFDALVGQAIEKWGMGETWGATNGYPLFDDFGHAYIDNTQGITPGTTKVEGAPWDQGALASFFGRVNYDWKETYMASLIMRADGSSNFARGQRWGYFPSVSAGWVVTNENFLKDNNIVDFLKLRGSWGQNGNCNIAAFQYMETVSFDATAAYTFGNSKEVQNTGGYTNNLRNDDITWETSEQTDLGIDARFLRSRLGLAFDWYVKNTKDWLLRAPIPGSIGLGSVSPFINGGDIKNSGFEVALNWNDQAGELTYGVNANLSYNKNEVTRIANEEGIIHGQDNAFTQGVSEMYRAQEGFPIGYFWGYKTAGIFQNQADIDAWRATGDGIVQANVQPGDVKFVDLNHDGTIDAADKTNIGDPNPTFRGGFGFNFGYKGIDLSVTTFGAFGQKIAKNYRKFADSPTENFTKEDADQRWTGEGTSNKWPQLTSGTNVNFMNFSEIFIENGDYLKVQNVTIGYDLKHALPKLPVVQARIYFTAQNLFTFTGYSGFDPEVGYSPVDSGGNSDSWSSGIDLGFYPNPRTYLVGLNLKF